MHAVLGLRQADVRRGDVEVAHLEVDVGDTGERAAGPPRAPTQVVRPSGGLYDGSSYVNSGQLGNAPGRSGTSFTLTFTKAGSYSYICILHVDQGMAGVIEVGAAGTGGAPALRPPATGDAGLADSAPAAWPLALAVAFAGIATLGVMRARARI